MLGKFDAIPMVLEGTVLAVQGYTSAEANIFKPSLGEQRYRCASEPLIAHKAERILDLGKSLQNFITVLRGSNIYHMETDVHFSP